MSMSSTVDMRREGWAFVALVLVTMAYLIVRAVCMPLIHDEANSFWWYVRTGEFFPFHAHRDTGNHFLSSFFGWIGYGVFGATEWAVRIGSLLAAVLYAFACWRITIALAHAPVRWAARVAMLWCPFLIEYFALFRGYALGITLWLWALIELWQWLELRRVKDLALMTLALIGAVFANLTFLPGACVVFGAMFLWTIWLIWPMRGLRRSLASIGVVLLCASALVLAAFIAMDYKSHGMLSFGHQEFLAGTISELCSAIFPFATGPVTVLVVVLTILATGVGAWKLVRQRAWTHPLTVLCGAFWAEILMRVLMHVALGVDYPPARSSLHLVPLFVAIVAFAADAISAQHSAWQWSSLVLLPLPLLAVLSVNADHVTQSPEQGPPMRWAHLAALRQQELGRPIIVNGPELAGSTWGFSMRKEGVHVNDLEMEYAPVGSHDLRMATRATLEQASAGYTVMDSATGPGFFLLQPEGPLHLELVLDSMVPPMHGDREYDDVLRFREEWKDLEVLVRVTGRLATSSRSSDVQVVAWAKRDDGREFHDKTLLCHERDTWSRTPFDVMRRLAPSMAMRKVYLFNVTRADIHATDLRVRVYVNSDR
jgi:hypothetical protein